MVPQAKAANAPIGTNLAVDAVGDWPIARRPFESIFYPPLRTTVAGLWWAGVALAGFTAPLAWRRIDAVAALPFIGVAVGLTVLAVAVLRANRVALIVSTAGLGAQILGVVGSAWELLSGVHGSKADELNRLGIDPELGVALNLVYSAVASAVFVWVIARWRSEPRQP